MFVGCEALFYLLSPLGQSSVKLFFRVFDFHFTIRRRTVSMMMQVSARSGSVMWLEASGCAWRCLSLHDLMQALRRPSRRSHHKRLCSTTQLARRSDSIKLIKFMTAERLHQPKNHPRTRTTASRHKTNASSFFLLSILMALNVILLYVRLCLHARAFLDELFSSQMRSSKVLSSIQSGRE